MDITNAVGSVISTTLGELEIIKFLGKGKSGYSYLARNSEHQYVVKLMHYEPCAYYSFGNANKVELELSAYEQLKRAGIRVPELIEANVERNYIVKEYIEGDLVTDLIIADKLPESCIKQVCAMFLELKPIGLNIDYFPDNFVMSDGVLHYVDYEHNPYDEKWDLLNWGLFYWANSQGMKAYRQTKDPLHINESAESGFPIKTPLMGVVNTWVNAYC